MILKTGFQAGALLLALAGPASAATLLSENFDGAVSGAIGGSGGVTAVQGYAGQTGMSGSFWQNTTGGNPAAVTTVNLGGLASHGSITLSFSLALIDSWDSVTTPTFGPDYFSVEADGVDVLTLSWDEVTGFAPVPPTVTESFATANYGFGAPVDNGGVISVTFGHVSSSLSLSFYAEGQGWQGGADESWAIDSLLITSNTAPVPLPAGGMLLLAALGGLGLARRRR
ncbi:VPLPA-CTERM sorting domain-containing protein [Primorskyibacter sp. 2E107]|uniref:VPLPA-CTERM sorting domain-containing protein n=1 Tax=Primorskyibacter sp. 2E107 TaxID=3403458 RepID=UPI003AF57AC4